MTNSQTPTISHIPSLRPLLPDTFLFSSPFSSVRAPSFARSHHCHHHHQQHHHSTNIASVLSQLTATSSVPRVPSLPLHTPATPELSRPGLPRRTHAHVHPHAHALTATSARASSLSHSSHSFIESFTWPVSRSFVAPACQCVCPPNPRNPLCWDDFPESGACRRFSARARQRLGMTGGFCALLYVAERYDMYGKGIWQLACPFMYASVCWNAIGCAETPIGRSTSGVGPSSFDLFRAAGGGNGTDWALAVSRVGPCTDAALSRICVPSVAAVPGDWA